MVVGLLACSSSSTPSIGTSRAAVVAALAGRPDELGSTARFAERVYSQDGSARRLLYQSEGVADFAHGRWAGTLNGNTGNGRDTNGQDFGMGNFVYKRLTGMTVWQKSRRTFGELGDPFPEVGLVGAPHNSGEPVYTHQPEIRRQIIDAAATKVDPLGTAKLRGAATRQYRVTLDGAIARKRLPALIAAEMSEWSELGGITTVDAWVDGQQRLRQISLFSPLRDHQGFTTEIEWWDFGAAPTVAVPPDLNDSTAAGGTGTTSFDLHMSSKGPHGAVTDVVDEHLVDGQPGVAITASGATDVAVDIDHRSMGANGIQRTLLLGIGLPRNPHLPLTLQVADTPILRPANVFAFQNPAAPCLSPSVAAGQLTIAELAIDDVGVERFRASMTLTCTTRGAQSKVTSTAVSVRFHALG
jgi:hypothetical protein